MNPLRIMPMPQNVWSKGPEDIYFQLMYTSL